MSSQQYPVSHQEAYQALVNLLEQGDEAQSCYSAKAIAEAQYQEALPQLNQCLYHPDTDVVIDATKALGDLGLGDVSSLIDVAKNHPDGDARHEALITLSKQTLLNDAFHPEKQRIIDLFEAMAKGRVPDDAWGMTNDWDEWWDLQLLAVQLFAQVATTDAIPLFKELLATDPEPELEMALYNALAQLDLEYCQSLLEASPSLTQARKITKAISLNPSPKANVLLFKQMNQSQDVEIKIIGIKALAQRNSKDYQWDLANQLCDNSNRVQTCALEALKQLDVLDDISLANLESLAQREQSHNLSSLLGLIDQHPQQVSLSFLDWLTSLMQHKSHTLTLGAARILAHKAGKGEAYQAAFERSLELAKNPETPIAIRIEFIHLLGQFQASSAPLLTEFRTLLDEKHHDVMIRQACFEAIRHFAHQPSYQTFLESQVLSSKPDNQRIPLDTDKADNSEEADNTQKSLCQQKEEEDNKIQVSSTLAAIAQSNQTNISQPNPVQRGQDHERNINNMLLELEEDFNDYSNIVSGHFQASGKLDLNRRKIAKRTQISNQILAIRSLAKCPYDFAAPLLIEALTGADPELQIELFNTMARLGEKQGTSLLKNTFAALANVMNQGDSLTKQAATRLLGQLRSRQSLTLILLGIEDEDEHVRICSLQALKLHMDVKPSALLPLLEIQRSLQTCLADSAGGVRKLALPLLARLEQEEDVVSLIECAIHDEESQSIAAKNLDFAKEKSLSLLAKKLPELENQAQYLAIQLTGQLLAR
ncbi:MAG: HEAT repeat domain-containing protein [Marinomonas sp.]